MSECIHEWRSEVTDDRKIIHTCQKCGAGWHKHTIEFPKVTKDTNPKDAIGSTKLDLGLVPDTLIVYAAMSFLEGALKYGRFNWRIAGVRASIYNAALTRHQMDWWNGEDTDPVTRVHNLASIIACAGILLDAELCGKLTDDRPPRAPVAELIDHAPGLVAHLKDLFKDYNPHQYTIEDSL